MKKMFLMVAFCCTAALQAQDYYVVTGDNVNVRSQPVTGKVVGKVSSVNSFTGWDAGYRLHRTRWGERPEGTHESCLCRHTQ